MNLVYITQSMQYYYNQVSFTWMPQKYDMPTSECYYGSWFLFIYWAIHLRKATLDSQLMFLLPCGANKNKQDSHYNVEAGPFGGQQTSSYVHHHRSHHFPFFSKVLKSTYHAPWDFYSSGSFLLFIPYGKLLYFRHRFSFQFSFNLLHNFSFVNTSRAFSCADLVAAAALFVCPLVEAGSHSKEKVVHGWAIIWTGELPNILKQCYIRS